MARFTVQMTFEAPAVTSPAIDGTVVRLPRSGSVRYLACDGLVAVTAVLRADTATEAAREVENIVERRAAALGFGKVRAQSWTAHRSVPALAGLRRGRGGTEWWLRGEDGDDGGTAGVREPRRPKPSPGTMSAARDLPHEPA
jgi:hypothetical protein